MRVSNDSPSSMRYYSACILNWHDHTRFYMNVSIDKRRSYKFSLHIINLISNVFANSSDKAMMYCYITFYNLISKYIDNLSILQYNFCTCSTCGNINNLLKGVITLVIMFGNPRDFDLQNPAPFNAGWFLDRTTTSPGLYSLLTSFDLFTLWVIALLGLGFSVAAKKMKFGRGFGVVFCLWLVMVVLGAGWAAAFG